MMNDEHRTNRADSIRHQDFVIRHFRTRIASNSHKR